MTLYSLIPFSSAFLCAMLASLACIDRRRSIVHRLFGLGMITLMFHEVALGMTVVSTSPSEAEYWHGIRLLSSAVLPASWILFSASFARAEYQAFVRKWRWAAFLLSALPLGLVLLFGGRLFTDVFALSSSRWVLRLGWSGRLVALFLLIPMVFIVVNLERTLRAATGLMRWQIKFMILGVGGIFAAQIYTNSHALLMSSVDTALEQINSAAILVGNGLVIFSLARSRLQSTDVYLSQSFLYNSITLTIVGIYLVAVGGFVKLATFLGGDYGVTIPTFVLFLALVGLSILLLSEQLKQQFRRFLNRHLKRPQYDYRKEWLTFTERTTSMVDIKHLCAAAAGMVSDTFGVPGVTIWLAHPRDERLVLGGSTVISSDQVRTLEAAPDGSRALLGAMLGQQQPVDLHQAENGSVAALKRSHSNYVRQIQMRYCVSLTAGGQTVGIMTLSDRLNKEPLSLEDLDLLKTIADQTASSLLNAKLTEQLLRSKKLEALQTVSAFFVHDLKNLAATLSLTLDNFRAYCDDPAFRQDALKTISQSVDKINRLCARLSLQGKRADLKLRKADLNEIVLSTVSSLNGSLKAVLEQDLKPLPRLLMDPEEMQKVVVNLVLNANEAVGKDGRIEIATAENNGSVVVSVSDNGCGMSDDFVSNSLFQPFQTTKKHGLGIGLFQSKSIVEAHGGKIEVESEKGKGTTFVVRLPSGQKRMTHRGGPEYAE